MKFRDAVAAQRGRPCRRAAARVRTVRLAPSLCRAAARYDAITGALARRVAHVPVERGGSNPHSGRPHEYGAARCPP